MPQKFLNDAERENFNTYPKDISHEILGRFFTLTTNDLQLIGQQRGDHNRLGFALQLCTLRYLGFIPKDLLQPPPRVLKWLAHQVGVTAKTFPTYGQREQTRSDHLSLAMTYLGYQRASLSYLKKLQTWLVERALEHDKPLLLLGLVIERLHWDCVLRPNLTSLEQIVSASRQQAHQVLFEQVSTLLASQGQDFFDGLLIPSQSGHRTKLNWLQHMPNNHTATHINTTLEKLQFLHRACVPQWDLSFINPNHLKHLANIGLKATNQHLQRLSPIRRYPILIAFLKQSLFDFTDVVIELFEACLWQCHIEAKAELDKMRLQAARSTNEKLRTFHQIAKVVMDDAVPDDAVRKTIFKHFKSQHLQQVVQETESLIRPQHDEAIDLFGQRYSYIRRFAPQFLSTLTFKSHLKTSLLLEAIETLKELNVSGKRILPSETPIHFITHPWRAYILEKDGQLNRRYYELAILWELRSALRSGDVFVEYARRYADPNTYLIPFDIWPIQRQEISRLTSTPLIGEIRLKECEAQIQNLAERVEKLHQGNLDCLREENGRWVLAPLEGEARSESAEKLEAAIVARLPRLDITDLLIEVDQWTNLTSSFNHISSGFPYQNTEELIYLYASLLAQSCNHSLAQMSRSSGLAHYRLIYANNWFLTEETLKQANSVLVNYHHHSPVSRLWGAGMLSSSDGQRFPVTGKNRSARSIVRYFGYRRGVTFYTWASDQFSLYGGKAITATVRDATYVLDEILANETELPILEHTTDTSGYTELVFALFDLLGLTFTPRIKDLQDQQLYRTEAIDLQNLPFVRMRLSKSVNIDLIVGMWDEMLRLVGSLKLGWVTASLVIQKLQAPSRKSTLVKALQEYGRLVKTVHALGWYESLEKRHQANRQLNKGEALHSLKAHISIGNRGVLRRKTNEGLQHQVGCLNLLTNAIILWNTIYMGEALAQLEQEGYPINYEDLKHIWPTHYEHINIYGKYEFNLEVAQKRKGLRELRHPDELSP